MELVSSKGWRIFEYFNGKKKNNGQDLIKSNRGKDEDTRAIVILGREKKNHRRHYEKTSRPCGEYKDKSRQR